VDVKDAFLEAYGRLPGLVERAVTDLEPEHLIQAPSENANTIAWLIWHLTRIQDSHIAELLDAEQIYLTGDWAPRFGRKPDPSDTGYGHSAAEVHSVRPDSVEALIDYYSAVHERTVGYLSGLTDADFDRVVDKAWDPPVTLAVRLASVLSDDLQHAGQAAYVRGLF
jgi:uncharacterized damage-inducible protein DinB